MPDTVHNDTGEFLALMADESHPLDCRCACGAVLDDPWEEMCVECIAEALEGCWK